MKKPALFALLVMTCLAAACSGRAASTTPIVSSTPELPRWKLYERALAFILLGPPGPTRADLSQDHGLCEWVILGQRGNEVYVWALCQVEASATGAATSAPAVIHLSGAGAISEVVMPNEGWSNVHELFPAGLLDGIQDAASAGLPDGMDHIDLRRHDPSIPPQIVLDGVQLP